MSEEIHTTVGDLRRELESCPDNTELIFQGGLTLFKADKRGPNLVQIEFNEALGSSRLGEIVFVRPAP
jgi:hypothetical protein